MHVRAQKLKQQENYWNLQESKKIFAQLIIYTSVKERGIEYGLVF